MDSLSQRDEHESCAKRLKLDLSEIKNSVLCEESDFRDFTTFKEEHVDSTEGKNLKNMFVCLANDYSKENGGIQKQKSKTTTYLWEGPNNRNGWVLGAAAVKKYL